MLKNRRSGWVLVLMCFFLIISFSSYAEKEGKDCLKDFDIGLVDFTDPKMAPYALNALEYFQCMAAAVNDINECEKIGSDLRKICRANFNEIQGFYGGLLLGASGLPQVGACPPWTKGDIKKCMDFSRSLATQDTSMCESLGDKSKREECIAVISLSSSAARDTKTKDAVHYIRAIKNFDRAECELITSNHFKRECLAFVTNDSTLCDKCEGIQKIKKIYCENIARRIQ